MKLINHGKSQWRRSQQSPIRTVLCITQNLHKGEYQSLVVFFFFNLSVCSVLAEQFGKAAFHWMVWEHWCCSWELQVPEHWDLKGWQEIPVWAGGTTEGSAPLRVRGTQGQEPQWDGNSAQQSSWAGLARILRICKPTGHSGTYCSHGFTRRISSPLEGVLIVHWKITILSCLQWSNILAWDNVLKK